ncbi:hypothetical protein BAUCODRAFT_75287 [Baudoinia panamericana UAMH 10762]|uniref:NAD-dependent epimerase/dehydratase domain-containing protein n=1 Tax=Baudoinia panamericana (strain UAMH 10762) TaxID=717646 RepID=M2N637_BAUPA|nr:uncharacterized protein BAUCODRAFT_75287 [Baudoinia panamericana UAMH 10762]EMC94250.1 hypothetical protein BAUCODRAFT_75287 [Baudoinia panamericana UAMH 10762]
MSGKTVFIVGPGFIGWNVLDLLIGEGYIVTGLVRRREHAEGIKASGATPVMGDLNNRDLIVEQSAQHDIVIHTATADHLPSVQAVLNGVKKRIEQGKPTIFIHTSGTSVLDDGAKGMFKSDKVFHDSAREEVDSVPQDAPHRAIDLEIVKMQKQFGDQAKLAIMIPPLIYGFNPKHKRLTIQIPTITRFALKHGFAPYVGKGAAVESNIHVMDLARAYITLLHHIEQSTAQETMTNPYYFCECTGDNEPSWYDVASLVGESLHKAGRIQDPKPREVPKELYGDLFGEFTEPVVGLNSRSRALRLRELGWEPREKDWKSSYVEDELPELLREETGSFSGYAGAVAS